MNWMTSFRKELEKSAGLGMGAAMGALNLMDLKSSAKQKMEEVRMTPLKQQAQSLQLPGSNSFQFEGSKRIDSTANETSDKF
jgi:hypothetical protein